jgi:3-mercaptopyruvate sulfurtransferase SseA
MMQPDQLVSLCISCRVAVLEGGLTAWAAAGLPLEDTPAGDEDLKASTAAASAAQQGSDSSSSSYKAKLDQSKVRPQV